MKETINGGTQMDVTDEKFNEIRYWTMRTLPIVITLSRLRALHDALRETGVSEGDQ